MSLANAILRNQTQAVQKMLDSGEDANEIDEYGFTPLIETAIANNTEMANLLIAHNAKVNEPDVTGNTALHWAAENNNIALARLLLEHGADANAYNRTAQPVLLKPLLRNQQDMKQLLYEHNAKLEFTQDYLNTKLLGHKFELSGRVDIVDPFGKFIEMDYEGFIIEFSCHLMHDSLQYYRKNFAARDVRPHFKLLNRIINAFNIASELIQYQQYMIDINRHLHRIKKLLNNNLLLLPVGYEGHAITFIRYKNLFARCDRGEEGRKDFSVIIYKVNKPKQLNKNFYQNLLYKKHSADSINNKIKDILGLEYIDRLPIESQVAGNCSWANLEAAIPTIYFMLSYIDKKTTDRESIIRQKEAAMYVYKSWLEWDKDFALNKTINSFNSASPARKASIAAVLAAVLFQTCEYKNPNDQKRATKILDILSTPSYRYVLDSYITIYSESAKTDAGQNLLQLLDIYGR